MSWRGIAGALAVHSLAACAGAAPDFWVHETAVEVDTDAPFARAPDLSPRVETTVQAALAYWGGDWRSLAGARIVLAGDRFACGGAAAASGCWDGEALRVSTHELGEALPCLEVTALVHEVGHAVLGDPDHEDPRWMDFGPVAEALAGRAGYAEKPDAGAPGACEIAVSAWRHLPAR